MFPLCAEIFAITVFTFAIHPDGTVEQDEDMPPGVSPGEGPGHVQQNGVPVHYFYFGQQPTDWDPKPNPVGNEAIKAAFPGPANPVDVIAGPVYFQATDCAALVEAARAAGQPSTRRVL